MRIAAEIQLEVHVQRRQYSSLAFWAAARHESLGVIETAVQIQEPVGLTVNAGDLEPGVDSLIGVDAAVITANNVSKAA